MKVKMWLFIPGSSYATSIHVVEERADLVQVVARMVGMMELVCKFVNEDLNRVCIMAIWIAASALRRRLG